MNVVIMAGGGGTRLWPLSRQDSPKQFIDLGQGKTLLEMSYERARKVTAPERIYVATLEKYQNRVQKLLPHVFPENIFLEPAHRETTAAFATIAKRLQVKGEGETPAVFLWSDHIFSAEDRLQSDLKLIGDVLARYPDTITLLGHTAIAPETGFGYIEVGDKVAGFERVYQVKKFKEKPQLAQAESFVAAGNYFWNMGYFSGRPQYLLSELLHYQPELAPPLDEFGEAIAHGDEKKAARVYGKLPKMAIEYTLIERTARAIVITGDYGWSDVGNWGAVKEMFGIHGDYVPHGHHVHVDSENNYVYNATDRAVSLVGVQDMIVVVTDDAVLITDKDTAHQVKEVVNRLKAAGQDKYL